MHQSTWACRNVEPAGCHSSPGCCRMERWPAGCGARWHTVEKPSGRTCQSDNHWVVEEGGPTSETRRETETKKPNTEGLLMGWNLFFFCFTARRSWVQIQDIYGVKCTTLDNFKKKDQNRLTDQIWVFNKYTMPAGDSFFLLHWHFIWMNLESWNRRNSSRLMDHQSDLYKKSNWWTLALMQSVRQLIPLWAPAER